MTSLKVYTSQAKHHCHGDLYYVSHNCTLHPHHSNVFRQQEKRGPDDKKCPDCYKLKIIYPKNVSSKVREELRRAPSQTAHKADSVSIYAHLKKNRRAEHEERESGIKNNYTLMSYFRRMR